LLLSKILVDKLPINADYVTKRIGEISLRGKSTDVILYTIERTNNIVSS